MRIDELSFTYESIACFKEESLMTPDSLQPEVEKSAMVGIIRGEQENESTKTFIAAGQTPSSDLDLDAENHV
jgi:hypothetical protein